MTDLSLVPEIAAHKDIDFRSLINWMIKDASKKGNKLNIILYITLIIILSSINNYNYKNIFIIKNIKVNGFSDEKNKIVKKDNFQTLFGENIIFLDKKNFEN